MPPPGVACAGPVLAICRSADGVSGTELVAVSFALFGSVVPAAAMVAVLTSNPIALDANVPATVNVAVPAGPRFTVVAIAPVPDGAPHAAPLPAVQVQLAPMNAAGKTSETVAPVMVLGPLLVTTIV